MSKKRERNEGSRRSERKAKEEEQKKKKQEYAKEFEHVIEKEDSDEQLFDDFDMEFLSSLTKPQQDEKPATPARSRFSIDSICEEAITRKKVDEELKQVGSGDGRASFRLGEVPQDLEGYSVSDLKRMVDSCLDKSPEDMDLVRLFNFWTPEQKDDFHSNIPKSLPKGLVEKLYGNGEKEEREFVKLILCGNWIPTLFPQSCPVDVGKWLFDCIVYDKDDTISGAAWDAWTFYYGRGALWNPEDSSFSWFRRLGKQKSSMEWIPAWPFIVSTLERFGVMNSSVYSRAQVFESDNLPADVNFESVYKTDRLLNTIQADLKTVKSFPVKNLRRFFSLMALTFFSSSLGRLHSSSTPYTTEQAMLLFQIALSSLVDPLLADSPKREIMQCIEATADVIGDDLLSISACCHLVTALCPNTDYYPVVSSLALFCSITERGIAIRRCLAFHVGCLLLEDRMKEVSKEMELPIIVGTRFSGVEMLKALAEFGETLFSLLELKRCSTSFEYMWLYEVLNCMDLALSDRMENVDYVKQVGGVLDKIRSFHKQIQMDEWCCACQAMNVMMKSRIVHSTEFEKNKKERQEKERAASRIGETRKITDFMKK